MSTGLRTEIKLILPSTLHLLPFSRSRATGFTERTGNTGGFGATHAAAETGPGH